jgi:hypothetical protein
LKTSKPAKRYQLFWFLLCNGNRVDRLAASHEHYAPPVQVRIRHKRCPLRATPIYFVSTLSWLRSALKRLPSFALDSCSLVTSLPGIKRKTYCYHPSINFESVEIQFVTAGFAENPLNHLLPKHLRPVRRKVAGFNRPPLAGFESTADTIREANSTYCGTRAITYRVQAKSSRRADSLRYHRDNISD